MEIKIVTFYQKLEIELNIKNKYLSNLKKPIFKNKFSIKGHIRGVFV